MDVAHYEMVGDIAIFRVGDDYGLEDGARRVRAAILRAKELGIAKLLVDIRDIGCGPPGVSDRHWVMTEWAAAGRGAIRLALVIRPEFIDPQHFGTAVARNHGLAFRAFTEESRAEDWLRDSD